MPKNSLHLLDTIATGHGSVTGNVVPAEGMYVVSVLAHCWLSAENGTRLPPATTAINYNLDLVNRNLGPLRWGWILPTMVVVLLWGEKQALILLKA